MSRQQRLQLGGVHRLRITDAELDAIVAHLRQSAHVPVQVADKRHVAVAGRLRRNRQGKFHDFLRCVRVVCAIRVVRVPFTRQD